jgi:hypothetical protein
MLNHWVFQNQDQPMKDQVDQVELSCDHASVRGYLSHRYFFLLIVNEKEEDNSN